MAFRRQILQEISYYEDGSRYVDKREINFSKLGDRVNLTRQTTSTKFKNLETLGLIEYIQEEDRYRLNFLKYQLDSLKNEVLIVTFFVSLNIFIKYKMEV